MSYEDDELEDDFEEDREDDLEDMCSKKGCFQRTIGDSCDGCGYSLCPMHAETGAMYCGDCDPATGIRNDEY